MSDLLPCPFCGSSAEYSVTSDEGQKNYYDSLRCTNCCAEMSALLMWHEKGGEHRERLSTDWNRRLRASKVSDKTREED